MLVKSSKHSKKIDDFPKGKNVRITIAGLAVCQLKPTPSKSIVNFLQHVDHHKLKLLVKKRVSGSTNEVIDFSFESTKDTREVEFVTNFATIPNNYLYKSRNKDLDINRVINLSKEHNIRFSRNTKSVIKMILENCQFYTKALTSDEYIVFTPDNLQSSYKFQQLGEVIGAYMNISEKIELYEKTVQGKKKLKEFLMVNQNRSYEYEFEFTNHCNTSTAQDIKKCKEVIGNDGSDIRFLYDIIKPSKNKEKKVILLKASTPKNDKVPILTPDVAACLPAISEPCDECT